jgi:hypothetical protein
MFRIKLVEYDYILLILKILLNSKYFKSIEYNLKISKLIQSKLIKYFELFYIERIHLFYIN